jgi:hypothetical protein
MPRVSVTSLGGDSTGDRRWWCPGILVAAKMPYPRLLLIKGRETAPVFLLSTFERQVKLNR